MTLTTARTPASSRFKQLFLTGAAVVIISALVGTSMLSVGHLAGWGLATVGLAGLAWRGQIESLRCQPSRGIFRALLLWVAFGYVVQVWAYYHSGGFLIADLGFYADRLSNLALEGRYYSKFRQEYALADHFTPVLMVFAPLFKLTPSFLWLIVAKFLAFIVCPGVLYLLGREVLGRGSRLLFVLPCLWLVHTVLAYAFLFQFQASHLAPPLVLLGFLFAFRARYLSMATCLIIACGLKEDQALGACCVGLLLFFELDKKRLGLAVTLAAVVWGLLVFLVVIPGNQGNALPTKMALFGPLELWPQKLRLCLILLLTMGGLPLLHPRSLLFVVPAFGLQLVTMNPAMLNFRLHHQTLPVTALFVASLFGLRTLERDDGWWAKRSQALRAWALALGASALIACNGMLPQYSARLYWPTPETRATLDAVLEMRSQLPQDRAVYVTNGLGAYVIPHASLRMLPYDAQKMLEVDTPHAILLSKHPAKRVSPEGYAKRVQAIDQLAQAGRYERQAFGPQLWLYLSTP